MEGIEWRFILSYIPHFDDLWESAVKSAKRHILRTTREMRLTFEELYAMLTRIEACMNSQPRILYISSHSKDFNSLTSEYFLIGNLTYPDVTNIKMNLIRFQQAMHQQFFNDGSTTISNNESNGRMRYLRPLE